jgi:hypothetical protein
MTHLDMVEIDFVFLTTKHGKSPFRSTSYSHSINQLDSNPSDVNLLHISRNNIFRTYVAFMTHLDGGRPADPFHNVIKCDSQKHHSDVPKSQVIANEGELAVHIIAGVSAAIHDFRLFYEHLKGVADLIDQQTGEPCDTLADKEHIDALDSRKIHLVTSHKLAADSGLSQKWLGENRRLSQNRILIGNSFGRLSTNSKSWSGDKRSPRHSLPVCFLFAARWPIPALYGCPTPSVVAR